MKRLRINDVRAGSLLHGDTFKIILRPTRTGINPYYSVSPPALPLLPSGINTQMVRISISRYHREEGDSRM